MRIRKLAQHVCCIMVAWVISKREELFVSMHTGISRSNIIIISAQCFGQCSM